MLFMLGFGMISVSIPLILTKHGAPITVLIVVPLVFGLISGGRLRLTNIVVKSINAVIHLNPFACAHPAEGSNSSAYSPLCERTCIATGTATNS